MKKKLSNWGNYPKVKANVFEVESLEDIQAALKTEGSFITRGLGRCYGDASLGENVISTQKFNQLFSLSEDGILHCMAGANFDQILKEVVPQGWFLPVTPGTKFVTVGGAIAADVHGKNHHKEGAFCKYVKEIKLLTEEQELLTCSPTENTTLFEATCGGMGLTGIILEAKFTLKKIQSSYIQLETIITNSIEEMLEHFESSADTTYTVAWIDSNIGKKSAGRGVLLLGEHANPEALSPKQQQKPLALPKKRKFNLPFYPPSFVLNSLTISLLNAFYYHSKRFKKGKSITDYESFFYPLDSIHNWNRMYGKKGFVQYQMVVPKVVGHQGIIEILQTMNKYGCSSFLTVLKLFGAKSTPMSFPEEGYTLAMDFPVNKKVFSMLDELDAMVENMGGKVYLAKDARMKQASFEKMYQERFDFVEVRKKHGASKKFHSLLSKRLGIN